MSARLFDSFAPEALLLPEELKAAKRGIAELDRYHKKSVANDLLPRKTRISFDDMSDGRASLGGKLEAIASVALKREVGLEKYMVVRVDRDGIEATQLQVLTFGIIRHYAGFQWAWQLDGRNVRADGTLGRTRKHAGFREAKIERRRLDGTWERLLPRP